MEIERKRSFRNREIVAKSQVTGNGIAVLLTGGDLEHIGAVAVVGPDRPLQLTVFPGHREGILAENWAKELWSISQVPVVVSAGIHYDQISREEIEEVLRISKEMLEELIEDLRKHFSR